MRSIAIVNQKGGCGKTTTAVNLAGCLAADGARVLVVDMDPQAHATLALGVEPDDVEENLYEVLSESDASDRLERILVEVGEGLDLAPSGIVLSALEQKLASENAEARTERLSRALDRLPRRYDYAIIDCPPNVGLLTFNALRAAQEVIVPLEASCFALHGVHKLLETLGLLAERIGHELSVRVLPTLYDGRTRYARETLGEIRETFGDLCFDTVIRQNVKLREASRHGLPISQLAPSANGAVDYAALAVEVDAARPEAASLERPRAVETPVPAEELELVGIVAEDEDLEHAPRQVVVRFRDSAARDVRIAGDFNGWVPDKGVRSSIDLEGGTRVWTKILQLPPGTYQYRYVVDGEWRSDPDQPRADAGPNSVLVVR